MDVWTNNTILCIPVWIYPIISLLFHQLDDIAHFFSDILVALPFVGAEALGAVTAAAISFSV